MKTYTIHRYGQAFSIECDDAILTESYERGELCEYHMLDWMLAHIPHGGVWVDAGANIGNHALAFALRADLSLIHI